MVGIYSTGGSNNIFNNFSISTHPFGHGTYFSGGTNNMIMGMSRRR